MFREQRGGETLREKQLMESDNNQAGEALQCMMLEFAHLHGMNPCFMGTGVQIELPVTRKMPDGQIHSFTVRQTHYNFSTLRAAIGY